MRRVIGFLVLCALVVALAWWVAGLPGAVSLRLAGLTVETSAPIALLGLAVLLLVLLAVLLAVLALIRLPHRLRTWRARRQRLAGDQAITRTLVALAANEPGDSRLQSARARRLLGDTPQTLLLAAEAARVAGNEEEAAGLYTTLAAREDSGFLGLRGLFRQAVAREDWAAAASLARRAEGSHPGNAWLREERITLAVRTGDWARAQSLAEAGGPRMAYATAAIAAEPDSAQATRLARRVWTENPGFAPAALAYAGRLRAAGREGRALDVIRDAWKAAPHPDLSDFALAPITDPLLRLKAAERLWQYAPSHPESEFLLARTALADGLTGEARRHADRARAAGMNQRRLWLLIAELETREHGDTEAGRAAQREALRHAASADPDPAWRCEACGTTQPNWQPICPTCQTPGRITWSQSRQTRPLLAS
jgi:HemY protein